MIKYTVQKKLDNGDVMLVCQIYATSRADAANKALKIYEWNNWLKPDQLIVKKAV